MAAFGWLLNMCHPACPVDPLTHQMECLQADDPEGWERALAAKAGIHKTRDKWQSYADGQEQLKLWEATANGRQLAEDNARSDAAAAMQIQAQSGEASYHSRHHHHRRHVHIG
jgi:hypothetical protein